MLSCAARKWVKFLALIYTYIYFRKQEVQPNDYYFRWFLVPFVLVDPAFDLTWFWHLFLWKFVRISSLRRDFTPSDAEVEAREIYRLWHKRFLFSDLQRYHKFYLFTDRLNLRMAEELEIEGKGASAWPLYARAFKLWPPLETEHNELWKQIKVLSASSSFFPLPDC